MNISNKISRIALLFLFIGLSDCLFGQALDSDTLFFYKNTIQWKYASKKKLDTIARKISNDSITQYGVFTYGNGKYSKRGVSTIEYLVVKKRIERWRLVLFTEHQKNIESKPGNYVVIRRVYPDDQEGCRPPPLPKRKRE